MNKHFIKYLNTQSWIKDWVLRKQGKDYSLQMSVVTAVTSDGIGLSTNIRHFGSIKRLKICMKYDANNFANLEFKSIRSNAKLFFYNQKNEIRKSITATATATLKLYSDSNFKDIVYDKDINLL